MIEYEEGHFEGIIVMVDFHNIAVRNAFIVVNADPEENRSWIKWRAKMIDTIIDLVGKFKAKRLIIAVDSATKKYWRHDVYPEYKANRSMYKKEAKVDFDSLNSAMDNLIDDIKNILPIYVVRIDGSESDDIIAVLTKYHGGSADIVIVSSDKDFCQLTTKFHGVKQYDLSKRKFIMVPNPIDHIDVKVLTGDRGDGIPPVKRGIGPKTAQKYVKSGVNMMESSDKELVSNYKRNRVLIDFDFIPENVSGDIRTAYLGITPSELDPMTAYSWVTRNCSESGELKWQQYSGLFNELI